MRLVQHDGLGTSFDAPGSGGGLGISSYAPGSGDALATFFCELATFFCGLVTFVCELVTYDDALPWFICLG